MQASLQLKANYSNENQREISEVERQSIFVQTVDQKCIWLDGIGRPNRSKKAGKTNRCLCIGRIRITGWQARCQSTALAFRNSLYQLPSLLGYRLFYPYQLYGIIPAADNLI